jgi:hypothetical protein
LVREDILHAFPQHPLCEADCDRVPELQQFKELGHLSAGPKIPWDELNKLN